MCFSHRLWRNKLQNNSILLFIILLFFSCVQEIQCLTYNTTHALAIPDIDSYVGLMHTLFTLEDLYGLHIDEIDGELCLRLDKSKGTTYLSMFDMFHAWQEQAEKLKSGEITQEEYDQWRYNYPKNAK